METLPFSPIGGHLQTGREDLTLPWKNSETTLKGVSVFSENNENLSNSVKADSVSHAVLLI